MLENFHVSPRAGGVSLEFVILGIFLIAAAVVIGMTVFNTSKDAQKKVKETWQKASSKVDEAFNSP